MIDWAYEVLRRLPLSWIEGWQAGALEFPTDWTELAIADDDVLKLALGTTKVEYRAVDAKGLEVRVTPPAYAQNISVEIGFRNPP